MPVIPPALTDLIVAKAEGSPFYVEELIKVLIENGIIIRGEETWEAKADRLSALKVPATLTGLLQARLDSLNPTVRETLQQASVVGRIFWTNVVEQMRNPESQTAGSSIPINDRLGILRAKELVFRYDETASSEIPEFIFKNAILHDVTYESVLLKLRPVYHLQAAEGLIGISGERISEYAGRVGEHYERAGEWLKASEWYARAGRQAQDTYEPESAIGYYQKTLDFLNKDAGTGRVVQKLEIYPRLGEVLNWQARYTEAIDTYHAMLGIAKDADDSVAQSRALQGLATSLGYLGDNRAALESAMDAETLARDANGRIEIARALWTQGSARYRLGEPQKALALGEQALAIAAELNNQNEMARSLNLMGAAHYASGRYDQAENYWENALKIFQELGNRQQSMDLSSNLGVIADARGDYDTAFQRYNNALEIAREIGYRDGEIVFLTNRGSEQVALKNYEAAEADLRQAIRMAGITGSWCMPITFNYHAESLIGLGRYEEALYSARQALALAEEDKTPEYIGMAWRTLGMVAGKTGNPIRIKDRQTHQDKEHDAAACFSASEKILSGAEIEMEQARTLREWARYEYGRGNREQGAMLWREASHIFSKLGAQMEVKRMRKLPE